MDVRAELENARARVAELEENEADLQERLDNWDNEVVDYSSEPDDDTRPPSPLPGAEGPPGPPPEWIAKEIEQIELTPILEEDEEGGGELRAETAEDLAAQRALAEEVHEDVDTLCAWIRNQLEVPSVASKICFDAPTYARELLGTLLRSRTLNKDTPFITPNQQEHFVCGGATQAGKTMFVVVGVVVAFAARVPSVVITTTVSGTKSLFEKVRSTLLKMPDGARLAACVSHLSGAGGDARLRQRAALGASDDPHLRSRGTLFVADTANQILRAKELLHMLRLERQGDPEHPCSGQFLLFLDEADALQRTDGETHEMIQLERRLATLCGGMQNGKGEWCPVEDDPENKKKKRLGRPAQNFDGPQAVVSISATLLPVFLRMKQRAANGVAPPAVHPYYTETTNKNMKQYVGVQWDKWLPMKAADGEPVFLAPRALNFQNISINEDVWGLYEDAVTRNYSLLLDITVSRVNMTSGTVCAARVCCHARALLTRHPSPHPWLPDLPQGNDNAAPVQGPRSAHHAREGHGDSAAYLSWRRRAQGAEALRADGV